MKKDYHHTYILTLTVHNNPGVLVRCAQIFNRRSHNIEALQIANTSNDITDMTITAFGDPATINQITLQLKKLIDVIKVTQKEIQ